MMAFRQMKPGTNHFFYGIHGTYLLLSKICMPAAMKNINGAFLNYYYLLELDNVKGGTLLTFAFYHYVKTNYFKVTINGQETRNPVNYQDKL